MTAIGADLRVSVRRLLHRPVFRADGCGGARPGHRRQRPSCSAWPGWWCCSRSRTAGPTGWCCFLERPRGRATPPAVGAGSGRATSARRGHAAGLVAAYTTTASSLTDGAEPERVRLGVGHPRTVRHPGRGADARPRVRRRPIPPLAPPAPIVIGHGLWQRRFGGDPGRGRARGPARWPGPHRDWGDAGRVPPAARLPRSIARPSCGRRWPGTPANLGSWGNRSYIGVARLAAGAHHPPRPRASSRSSPAAGCKPGSSTDQGDGWPAARGGAGRRPGDRRRARRDGRCWWPRCCSCCCWPRPTSPGW